ncbi:MAG: BlaI/MecI/CopY family transcriptional regulator [Clostridia bacterium]|nr:BlaI/MecI/CopY family transcriptional regulator [Oscillospiraceae bacterium]MBQ4048657.1 BlaI/MecI/CopY family transcriptional regulator [Clostridia bacterium]MBR7136677.1 BlaI/MecI/CopY family transcriptional regulator [Clostridia bacterium]
MADVKRLAESDLRFLQLIWDHEPVASMALVALCAEKFGWKKSTTYTMIKRLCEKGLIRNENAVVSACARRSEVQAHESEQFVEQTFAGSLPHFLAAFLNGKTISAEDAAKLKRLIDEHKEE